MYHDAYIPEASCNTSENIHEGWLAISDQRARIINTSNRVWFTIREVISQVTEGMKRYRMSQQDSFSPGQIRLHPKAEASDGKQNMYAPDCVCPVCGGAERLRITVPYGNPLFGKSTPCACMKDRLKIMRQQELRQSWSTKSRPDQFKLCLTTTRVALTARPLWLRKNTPGCSNCEPASWEWGNRLLYHCSRPAGYLASSPRFAQTLLAAQCLGTGGGAVNPRWSWRTAVLSMVEWKAAATARLPCNTRTSNDHHRSPKRVSGTWWATPFTVERCSTRYPRHFWTGEGFSSL